MEQWDVYDENRCRKGYTHQRGTAIARGDYRLVVHVCIFNALGEMLIQQRQSFKRGWSNYWDVSVGGSVCASETSSVGIQRELQEEIGIAYDFSDVRPRLTVNFEQGFDDWYVLEMDVDIAELHIQQEEIQALRWATLEEIYNMIDNNTFIPYHKELFPLLYATKSSYGAHHHEGES